MELALVMPFLLILVFGILEVSRLIETQHIMSSLSREGANLASRGTSMAEAAQRTMENLLAQFPEAEEGACVIVSELTGQGEDAPPTITGQVPQPSGCSSQIGEEDYADAGLLGEQLYYVVEVSVPYRSFTPFQNFLHWVDEDLDLVPDSLYDRTLF